MTAINPDLLRGVDLLCLDAGNTIIFLDHARLAACAAREGFSTSAAALVKAEGEMKLALESSESVDTVWRSPDVLGAKAWGVAVGTLLRRAGLESSRLRTMLDALWAAHRERNFWSLVPDGLRPALDEARARGVRVAVVSNSEGRLDRVLDEVGLLSSVDLALDSCVLGIEKPDPRIFTVALEHFGAAPSRALHLGDMFVTDIIGARAAGIRCALIDPYDHYRGCHADVPRVPGAREVALSLAALRDEFATPMG